MRTRSDLRPIRSEGDYRWAIAEIERLTELDDEDASQDDRLEILAILVANWRNELNPVRPASPADALRHAIEDRGIPRRKIAEAIGGESRVSEILSGKRGLSTRMISVLHARFGIPLRSLLSPARPRRRSKKH